jgi:hypothetical protein
MPVRREGTCVGERLPSGAQPSAHNLGGLAWRRRVYGPPDLVWAQHEFHHPRFLLFLFSFFIPNSFEFIFNCEFIFILNVQF